MGFTNWGQISTTDFADLDKNSTLVILPIGSMEQHGPHLPVAQDALSVNAVIDGLSHKIDNLNCLLLPTLWCSKSNEHIDFPGTIFLKRETVVHVLEDIASSVARTGFKKFVIINWHGGNIDLLSCLARDIHQQFGIWTFVIDAFNTLVSIKPSWLKEHHFNIHADRYETSIALGVHPEKVKPENEWGAGSDFGHGKMASMFSGYKHLIPEDGKVSMGWVTTDLTDDGVIGDPIGANANEGKEFLGIIVSNISEILPEIASFAI